MAFLFASLSCLLGFAKSQLRSFGLQRTLLLQHLYRLSLGRDLISNGLSSEIRKKKKMERRRHSSEREGERKGRGEVFTGGCFGLQMRRANG